MNLSYFVLTVYIYCQLISSGVKIHDDQAAEYVVNRLTKCLTTDFRLFWGLLTHLFSVNFNRL